MESRFNKSEKNIALAVLIAIKVVLYYAFMEVNSNFLIISCLTALSFLIIVGFLENKKLGAVLYCLLSILMFMDVTYFSYFNRNLSVNMIQAAGLLGDVTDSILKILKPKFFLLIADAVVILYYTFIINKKARWDRKIITINTKPIETKSKVSFILICIIILVLLNPFKTDIFVSVSNQEFFSYHIKDLLSSLQPEETFGHSIQAFSEEYIYENDKRGNLFGIAKDRNLIVLQIEALQNMVINKTYDGQEITPNLNKLIQGDSIYFDNYYQQLGSGNTSDAEFTSNNSLHGSFRPYTYNLYTNNYFHGLPWILKDLGYNTMAFHGYKKDFWNREEAYPIQGFDVFYNEEDYIISEPIGFGLNDKEFFQQSVDMLKNARQPFYGFFVTLTNHHPFEMPEEYNKITLKSEDEETIFGNYLQSVHYTDEAIGMFIEDLKKNDLYDNAVIAIYGDHFGLNCKEDEIRESVSRFLGYSYDFDEMLNIPLVIHIPGLKRNQTLHITGGQIDFLPTMAYIMGVEKLNTLYLGRNLITSQTGFVASQTYMCEGSFIKDDIIYEMSRDGVFSNGRAWNIHTKEPVDLELCKEGYLKAVGQIETSHFYLENDVIRQVFLEGRPLEEIFRSEQEEDDFSIFDGPGSLLNRSGPILKKHQITHNEKVPDISGQIFYWRQMDFMSAA
ncbi:MAG: LTA synthase family protein [Clostridiales bacterium]|nr:LTA synthase family protein [Clostridiales bacterium]